jgi:hypothetical protein
MTCRTRYEPMRWHQDFGQLLAYGAGPRQRAISAAVTK